MNTAFKNNFALSASLACSMGAVISPATAAEKALPPKPDKPNVLFIAVDDLRPELACYGKEKIKSPNIDKFAKSGVLFKNAFVNYPVCGPSRACLMSGIYPSENRWTTWDCSQDEALPGIVSMPMHFKNNGYTTVSLGKVYNNSGDGKGSWNEEWRAEAKNPRDYNDPEITRLFDKQNNKTDENSGKSEDDDKMINGPAFERPDVPDSAYRDGKIAARAIEELKKFKNGKTPFFLAVGFHKPHLPFNAPDKYWKMYDDKDIILPENRSLPTDAPESAIFNFGELRKYQGIPKKGPVPDELARKLIHGYYASVSYVDAQIGKVLEELEALGLADNTIVVLWGDNGWFLAEHGFWSKHANFRLAAHTPLIVRAPWINAGAVSGELVETVDIYPTICELGGLPPSFHLQGKSFLPLIKDPSKPWKEEVFYRMQKAETVITKSHAYTEWMDFTTGKVIDRMLYDHRIDLDENVNIAEKPENAGLVKSLHEKLQEQIKRREIIKIQKGEL